jgi:hypothetical protein
MQFTMAPPGFLPLNPSSAEKLVSSLCFTGATCTALQPGAYNRMVQISPEALKRGVICSSAGNHAQVGCALVTALFCKSKHVSFSFDDSRVCSM